MASRDLHEAVDRFVDDVIALLTALGVTDDDKLRHDVAVDAANLASALVEADGRITDDECWAYVDAFGARIDGLAGATPAALRDARLFTDKQSVLARPSVLLDLLLQADRRDDSRRSHTYYTRAMRLGHAMAAVDLIPSPSELFALETLRTTMLKAMDDAGIPRPGTPGASASSRMAGTPVAPDPVGAAAARGGPPEKPAFENAPLPPMRPIEELFAELDALVGLAEVKADVKMVTNLLQVTKMRRERNLPVVDTSNHLVFTGNPGTGKTTVARLIGQIYRTLGVVSKGQLVETDRSKLVAGFVGQTAMKTAAAVESAIGGVLLIDEAYALARGGDDDFGREAIDTLVKTMEDHRDDLALIAAGYPEEMTDFIEANPGLRSRFTRTVHFPDYTDDELVKIFCTVGDKHRYTPTTAAVAELRTILAAQARDRGFGNARFVRNLFERAVSRQATRLVAVTSPTDEQLTTLEPDDLR